MFGPGSASDEVMRMDILAIIILLLMMLLASTWSFARSYFQKGRMAGIEEATLEIRRGIRSHYERAGEMAVRSVEQTLAEAQASARRASGRGSIHRHQARLWMFGDALGAACWRRGYDDCRRRLAPAEDQIRVDLSISELLQLTMLAHVGFRKMMPNDGEVGAHRFLGEEQALAMSCAIERLEQAIPDQVQPLEHANLRRALIRNWWPQRRSA
jgi:hypothetical protein